MKLRYGLMMMAMLPYVAQAEIYKHVDENGHTTYSSVPIKGGRVLVLDPLPVTQSKPAAGGASKASNNPSPASFPRVDSSTQRARDDKRQQILQEELDTEMKLLDEAKKKLKEGEDNPEVFQVVVGKKPDGSPIYQTRRNAAKYDEKVKALSDEVETHQRNIEALKVELSKTK